MGKAVLIVLGIVLFVYAVFDLLATPAAQVKLLPKIIWLALLLVPVAGPLLWIFWGHVKEAPPGRTDPDGRHRAARSARTTTRTTCAVSELRPWPAPTRLPVSHEAS